MMTPEYKQLLAEITTGVDFLTDFLSEQYFDFYIPAGGSKIKFLTGRAGSGKTHFANVMQARAEEKNFLTVSFSAEKVWLHDFREIYLEILRQCNIERVLEGCARTIISEMGFNADEVFADYNDPSDDRMFPDVNDPSDENIQSGDKMYAGNEKSNSTKTFIDYLSERNEADALTKNIIRGELRKRFSRNPLLEHTFADCCSLLVGGILGHPVLEPASREMILAFLHGDKTVKLSQMRAIGLSPTRVNKYNARHMLRSLAEIVHMAGYAGILISIDDVEVLQRKTTDAPIRYTKMRREDAYESIRQLIDDIDSMRYIFFMFAFDRELIDNESRGLKSYQALWFRIQNEVIGTRFNRFADIIDMDRLADQIYTPEILVEMSEKIGKAMNRMRMEKSGEMGSDRLGEKIEPLSLEEARELIERSQYGGIGLPYLVNWTLMEGGRQNG